jgi:hypothetical protein
LIDRFDKFKLSKAEVDKEEEKKKKRLLEKMKK